MDISIQATVYEKCNKHFSDNLGTNGFSLINSDDSE